jgi:hypothetical protein
MISPMTAATILMKKGHTENIKQEALRIASLYEGRIQIQIDVNRGGCEALVRITEYGL